MQYSDVWELNKFILCDVYKHQIWFPADFVRLPTDKEMISL